MRRVWLAVAVLAAACTHPPVKAAGPDLVALTAARLAEADAKILVGCYDCLLEARATYEASATGAMRPAVIQRLFETTLLIAVRERELALDSAASFDAARRLVP